MACTSLSTRWATGVAIPAVCSSSSSSRCSSNSANGRRSVVIVAEERPNRQGKKMAKSPKGKTDFSDANKVVDQLREWTEKSTTFSGELDPLLMKIKESDSETEKKPASEKEKKPTESKKGLFGF